MSNVGKDKSDESGESRIRGRDLGGSERGTAPDHVDDAQRRNTDSVIRTDGEPDSLYQDGIELEDDSDPLTGINGADDSQSKRD